VLGDNASAPVLKALHAGGTRLLALRSAGFNHVDVAEADRLGLTVLRVPAYSPHAVAEHAVGLMLTLNRKFHRAFNRVREQNFALDVRYVSLPDLCAQSDIITLHCPLNPETKHLVNATALAAMKPGVMLINTSRGGVIDTRALIAALKKEHVGSVGLDVYEEEGDLFFKDLSERVIRDDVFGRLMSFPSVLITAHQGFFTREACTAIAQTTINNVTDFECGCVQESNRVTTRLIAPAPKPC